MNIFKVIENPVGNYLVVKEGFEKFPYIKTSSLKSAEEHKKELEALYK